MRGVGWGRQEPVRDTADPTIFDPSSEIDQWFFQPSVPVNRTIMTVIETRSSSRVLEFGPDPGHGRQEESVLIVEENEVRS